MTKRIPKEVFIESFRRLRSPAAVSKELGIPVRAIYKRRLHIMAKYDIDLKTVNVKQNVNTTIKQNAMATFAIDSGVIIVGGDMHYWPGQAPTMHRAYVELCKELKPSAVVVNGDAFDGARISRWPSIGWESRPDVKQELEVVQERLSEIQKAAKGARRFWTAGNHDLRFESRLAAVAPEYRGIKGIHLKDHFPEWIPCWFVSVNNDQVEIRHRESGGIHASYNNTLKSGVTMVTGHDHRADVVPYNDRKGRRYGVRHGMMAENPLDDQFVHYLEGRRVNWQAGFAVLTFKNGFLLQPELCLQVAPGKVEWRGKILNV